MACTGTYFGGCCEPAPAGAVTIALQARQAGFQPFSWQSLERQFARFRNHDWTVTDIDSGAVRAGSFRFNPGSELDYPTGSWVETPGTPGPFNTGQFSTFRQSFFVEGTITETVMNLDWYGHEPGGTDLRQFHHYSMRATLSNEMPYIWDTALNTLAGLSFAGLPLGVGKSWHLSIGGVLTEALGPSFATGECDLSTTNTYVEYDLPTWFGASSFEGLNIGYLTLVNQVFSRSPTTMAAYNTLITDCSKTIKINPGYGRLVRNYWLHQDINRRNKFRYFCQGNIEPNTPIELFPVYNISGVGGFNYFQAVANFYPTRLADPCSLP